MLTTAEGERGLRGFCGLGVLFRMGGGEQYGESEELFFLFVSRERMPKILALYAGWERGEKSLVIKSTW